MFCPCNCEFAYQGPRKLPDIALSEYFIEIIQENFVLKSQARSTLIVVSILCCIFHGKVFVKLTNQMIVLCSEREGECEHYFLGTDRCMTLPYSTSPLTVLVPCDNLESQCSWEALVCYPNWPFSDCSHVVSLIVTVVHFVEGGRGSGKAITGCTWKPSQALQSLFSTAPVHFP